MIYGNRKSRILSGVSANMFGQLVTVGVQLAGVPLLLHYWGMQYYGEWLLLFSIPAYLGLSDLGFGTVATTAMSVHIARGEFDQARQIFRGAFFFIIATGLAVCTAFSCAVCLLPLYDWLKIREISPAAFDVALLLLTWYVFHALFLTILLGTYRTIGRYARGQMISNSFRLLEFMAMFSVVAFGGRVAEAALALLLFRICYTGFVWYDIRSHAEWLRLGKFSGQWPVVRRLLAPSFSMLTVYAGQNFVTQGLITITGITLGAASVVLFSTIRTLCNFAKQIVSIVNLSVFSEYAISLGNRDISSVRRLHVRSVQAIAGLTFLSVIGLKILGPFVLEFWTKGNVRAEEPFFTLYLCYILFNSLWIGSWSMLLGCNYHQTIARYYAFLSALVLVNAYFVLDKMGISFLPIILIASDAIFAVLVLRKSLELLEQSASDFSRQLLTWPGFRLT